ncbi:hypothetical protein P7H15_23045 [Paenibacillus larvae]|nr:hypothetical protein [Paenibacillus larvae]MDT2295108.1 hypothetical protein [Paenibacillus larvae]
MLESWLSGLSGNVISGVTLSGVNLTTSKDIRVGNRIYPGTAGGGEKSLIFNENRGVGYTSVADNMARIYPCRETA